MYTTFKDKHKDTLIKMAVDVLSDSATKYSAYDFFMDRQNIGFYMQSTLDALFKKELFCECEFF